MWVLTCSREGDETMKRTQLPFLFTLLASLLAGGGLITASCLSAYQEPIVPVARPALPEAEQVQTPSQPVAPQPEDVQVTEQPTKGNPDAPVTIVEFAEFYCPFCARHVWETIPWIQAQYIDAGLLKYEFRNLVVHGAIGLLAAVAGECAHEQGMFWPYHDLLFETVFAGRNLSNAQQQDSDDLKRLAGELGLEPEAFSQCLDDFQQDREHCVAEYDQCIQGGKSQAECEVPFSACLSVNPLMEDVIKDQEELRRLIQELPSDEQQLAQRIGTPTFFINGHILVGAQSFSAFQAMIDRELEKAQGSL